VSGSASKSARPTEDTQAESSGSGRQTSTGSGMEQEQKVPKQTR
jgi:hypothetical protein